MQTRWEHRGTPSPQTPLPGAGSCSASWSELALLGADGHADATISATAYCLGAERDRPVMFFWNGGPGASSTPLHFEGFGPHLRRDGLFEPNPDTLLPHADLVFVDPAGTGFSRRPRPEAEAGLLQTAGDAQAVAAFIRAWLEEHGRERSPVHLVGESYGGYRLAALLEHLDGLDVRSLTMVSPLLSPTTASESPGNDLSAVFQLPVLAAAHAFHAGRDPMRAWQEADAFAGTALLTELFRADASRDGSFTAAAERVAELTGMPLQLVLDERLRVPSEAFLQRRRADDGLVVGRLDTRVTGPRQERVSADRPPAADDPALGMGGGSVILSPAVAAHLHSIAGAPGDREYVGLSLDLNFAWDWTTELRRPEFSVDRSADLGAFAAARPHLRTLLIGGIFDLATPHAAALHAMRRSGVPARSRRELLLECGHSIDDAARPAARAAIAELLHQPEGGTP